MNENEFCVERYQMFKRLWLNMMIIVPDIYFSPEYGKLYEEIEDGKIEVFKYGNN